MLSPSNCTQTKSSPYFLQAFIFGHVARKRARYYYPFCKKRNNNTLQVFSPMCARLCVRYWLVLVGFSGVFYLLGPVFFFCTGALRGALPKGWALSWHSHPRRNSKFGIPDSLCLSVYLQCTTHTQPHTWCTDRNTDKSKQRFKTFDKKRECPVRAKLGRCVGKDSFF